LFSIPSPAQQTDITMAPSKHTAAIIVEGGGSVELREIDVPRPGVNEVLVKVVAAALNPTDCAYPDKWAHQRL